MELGNAAEILVIVLAAFLALLLLLGIIVAIKFIQLLNQLKQISEKVDNIASKAGSLSGIFKYTAGPAAVIKFLSNAIDLVSKHRKKGD